MLVRYVWLVGRAYKPVTMRPNVQTNHRPRAAEDFASPVTPVGPDTTNFAVLAHFTRYPELVSLPVVDGDVPIGLISRNHFMSEMCKPGYQETYGRENCLAFMNTDPLIVDAKLNLEALSFRTVEHGEQTLVNGFVVTKNGLYAGVGSCLPLMRVIADLQAQKNRQIRHSIDYASVIQQALMRASRDALSTELKDGDLVWEPRDVVGGDFYHFERYPNGWFVAIADCTGHGVPGAFMTLIASLLLSQALENHNPANPARVISVVNRSIKQLLGQEDYSANTGQSDDGLDGAFIWFNTETRELTFTGAKSDLFTLKPTDTEFSAISGDRKGVGYIDTPTEFQWTNHTLHVPEGTLAFVTTDGLIDQIGGPKQIALGKRRLCETLLEQRQARCDVINMAILNAYSLWQADQPRRDDLTFLTFRP